VAIAPESAAALEVSLTNAGIQAVFVGTVMTAGPKRLLVG